jgi:hypothetical protein
MEIDNGAEASSKQNYFIANPVESKHMLRDIVASFTASTARHFVIE